MFKFESIGSYVCSVFIIEIIRHALRGIILGHAQKTYFAMESLDWSLCINFAPSFILFINKPSQPKNNAHK